MAGFTSDGEAFLWDDGRVVAIAGFQVANLNDRAQIVGGWMGQAAVWERGQFAALPGGQGGVAADINEHQKIVGSARSAQCMRAVLWER